MHRELYIFFKLSCICIGILVSSFWVTAKEPSGGTKPRLILIAQQDGPVLTVNSPGAESIKHGFEGGSVLKLKGTYHLFTSEMAGDPVWVEMKLGHWTSPDRIHWKRIATLFESSGECQGRDPRAALWAPMPVYNEKEGQWDIFYVAYHCAPNTKTEWRTNYDGQIWRAVSKTKGLAGIGGPYQDVGIILRPDKETQPWEGLQGTDSFFPYKVGQQWYGFYGSAKTEKQPTQFWGVGLVSASELAGPWRRMAGVNPLPIDKVFVENPVVTRLTDGTYAAVYDTNVPNAVGYTWSPDGVHWTVGEALIVQPKGKGKWADDVRTPLGLIPEGNHQFTIFYTGYTDSSPGEMGHGGIGFVTVKMEPQK